MGLPFDFIRMLETMVSLFFCLFVRYYFCLSHFLCPVHGDDNEADVDFN